jgi:hypothetical protein
LVDDVWLDTNEAELVDAVEYLASGGVHFDIVEGTSVDKEHVIPLVNRLKTQFEVPCYAVLYDDDSAGQFTTEILVRLPVDPGKRGGIRSAIQSADEQFPGEIVQEWGRKWLAFSFELE